MSQDNACFLQYQCTLFIHAVTLMENDFLDANLSDFDTARQTWACIAVQSGIHADTLATRFQERILFSMQSNPRPFQVRMRRSS